MKLYTCILYFRLQTIKESSFIYMRCMSQVYMYECVCMHTCAHIFLCHNFLSTLIREFGL